MDYWGEGGGQRVCWPPSQNIIGGSPPLPTPKSDETIAMFNLIQVFATYFFHETAQENTKNSISRLS